MGPASIPEGVTYCKQEDVEFLKERLARGEFRPVIDRTYPLDDVVEAFRYVETGQKTGNVVIRVSGRAEREDRNPGTQSVP